jgi:hypothetical protein
MEEIADQEASIVCSRATAIGNIQLSNELIWRRHAQRQSRINHVHARPARRLLPIFS